MDLRPGGW